MNCVAGERSTAVNAFGVEQFGGEGLQGSRCN